MGRLKPPPSATGASRERLGRTLAQTTAVRNTEPGNVAGTVPTVDPEIIEDIDSIGSGGWVVTVFDNDTNTWDEVVGALIKATACTVEEAHMETWEVHHLGKSVVHHASQAECKQAAAIISTIGIRVTVTKE
ncbi:MAG: ATP-dependent Clp protease adaptor ClpS [Fimbriimonadales bacterium]